MKVLLVVDMQKDFVDGMLGTKEAQNIVSNVREKVEQHQQAGGLVIFTKDTHSANYLNTKEGKKLPVPHCIKGEEGWMLIKELEELVTEDTPIYEKKTFGSVALGKDLKAKEKEIEKVELIGLCTDICVISNALLLKAYIPQIEIVVDAKCCAGVTPESHENALKAMEMCQITVVN